MKSLAIIIGMIVIMAGFVSAELTINIDMAESFSVGETIKFDYTIKSDKIENLVYVEMIECPTAPLPLLYPKRKTIENTLVDTFTYLVLTEDIEPQKCKAVISVTSPVLLREEKEFKINTKPNFDFRPIFCKDKNCNQKTTVFFKGETVYIDFVSEFDDVISLGFLTYPNGIKKQVSIPSSILAEDIGTYTLEATGIKNGYKDNKKISQFAVNEKKVEIKSGSVCKVDGICSNKETRQNCPQDCLSGIDDGYCDKERDGICDPDCNKLDDKDCNSQDHKLNKNIDNLILPISNFKLVIISVLILIILYVVISERKK